MKRFGKDLRRWDTFEDNEDAIMKVSAVIITLNEVGSIGRVLEEIPRDCVDEIVVVDGRSSDGTAELVRKLGYNVIVQKEKGYGTAFMEGARHATGDVLVLMNGDGSMDPKEIPKFLDQVKKGYKVVFGSRYAKGARSADDTIITYVGNKIFTFLTNFLCGVGISDCLFMYVVVRKDVLESLGMRSWSFEFCIEFPIKVHKKKYKFAQVPCFERKRFCGTKKVNAFFDGLRILWVIIREAFSC